MRRILTATQMADADRNTIEKRHIPSLVLMERAALSVCDEIEKILGKTKHIGIVCGTGNNGGDGLAMVRILKERGYRVDYFVIGDENKFSESARHQMDVLRSYGYKNVNDLSDLEDCDLVVDAIFGTGLTRKLDEKLCSVISVINSWPCIKLAVDIPSGINATTGEVMGEAFVSDMTVTFAFSMVGHFLYPGKAYCGKLIIKDIGITTKNLSKEGPEIEAVTRDDILYLLPRRVEDSHKGSYGKVLVIAGSKGMAGACYLASKAAYISGTGLVKILTCDENRVILQQLLPEAMVVSFEKKCDESMIKESISWADSVVLGPGLGVSDESSYLVNSVLQESNVPVVCDADALNVLANDKDVFKNKNCPVVVTPHLGEMSRLTQIPVEDIKSNLIDTAKNFSDENKVACVLKSASTVVSMPKGRVYINIYGNNGMSTGGSGDILSGVIGGLLAQGLSVEEAASLGVALHSLAGDEAQNFVGTYAMKAEDILEGLILFLKQVEDSQI